MKTFTKLAATVCLAVLTSSCATSSAARQRQGRGFLRLEVEPADATVMVDEEYSGVANGWVGGVIVVPAGMRKVTLSADGYITQRFDLKVGADEEVTLILHLEPSLELPDTASVPTRHKSSFGVRQ